MKGYTLTTKTFRPKFVAIKAYLWSLGSRFMGGARGSGGGSLYTDGFPSCSLNVS